VQASDWALIRKALNPVFSSRIIFRVPRANPRERARIHSLNSRLKSADNRYRLFIDGIKAAHVAADLDGVALLEGGSGEIDKEHGDKTLTHISDALSYYVHYRFPVDEIKLAPTGPVIIGGGIGVLR